MNAPASPAGPRTPHTYDAFISYSHRADTDLAPHLRAALHRLAKPWYRTRALRVFLDEAALSAEPALWAGIERALSRSGAFILLLSPEAARSPWVNREVEHWVRSNGTDRLLLVLTAGDVAWSDTANGFDRSASSAVPEALYGAFASEPRHVDLRWAAGRTDLDLRNLSFLDAVAELAAPLHGVAKDELVGSDLREHRRAVWLMRIVIAALSVLLVASVLAGVTARRNARRAEQRRIETQSVRLRSESSSTRIPTDLSFLLAAQAFRMRDTADTRAALLRALQRTPDLVHLVRAHSSRVIGVAVSDDGKTVVSYDVAGHLASIDADTGRVVATATTQRRGNGLTATAAGVAVDGLSVVELRDWRTLELRRQWSTSPALLAGSAVAAGGALVIARTDGQIAVTTSDAPAPQWHRVAASLDAVAASGDTAYVIGKLAGGGAAVEAENDNEVAAIDLPTFAIRWHAASKYATALAPFRDLVTVGTTRGVVQLLGASDGSTRGAVGASPSPITAVAASPSDDRYVLISTDGGDYRYIEPAREVAYQSEFVHAGAVHDVARSPSGVAATGGADGVVAILDTVHNRVDGGRELQVAPLAVDLNDGATQLTWADDQGHVRVASLAADGRIGAPTNLGTVKLPRAIAFVGTDERSVAVTDEHGALVVFRPGAATRRAPAISGAPIVALRRMGADRVAGLRTNGLLQVWRLRPSSVELERTITDRASALDAQPHGGTLVAFFEIDSALVVVDAITGLERLRQPVTLNASKAVALHPSGTSVAVADATHIDVYDLAAPAREPARVASEAEVAALAYVDGGRDLVAGDSLGGVELFEVASHTSLGRLADEDGLAFRAMTVGDAASSVVIAHEGASGPAAQLRGFEPDPALREGCARLDRSFTSSERQRYDLDAGDAPCRDLPPVAAAASPAVAPSTTVPTTASAADPVTQERAAATAVATAAIEPAARPCVRAALQRAPWPAFDEVQRAARLGAGPLLTARLAPFARWCDDPEGQRAVGEDVFDRFTLTLEDVEARWNAAVGESPDPALGAMTGRWTEVPSGPAEPPTVARPVGKQAQIEVGQIDGVVVSVTVTFAPAPTRAVLRRAASVLATAVDGRVRGPALLLGLDLDGALRAPSSTSVTIGPVTYVVDSRSSGSTPQVVSLQAWA